MQENSPAPFLFTLPAGLITLGLDAALRAAADDYDRVDVLNDFSQKFWYINAQHALHYAEAARSLAETLDYREGLAISLFYIGTSQCMLSDYTEATQHLRTSLHVFESVGDLPRQARVCNQLGLAFDQRGLFADALKIYFQGVSFAELSGEGFMRATLLDSIGTVYRNLGDLSAALKYYLEGLAFVESGEASPGAEMLTCALANNIGSVQQDLGNFTGALENYLRSLRLAEQQGNRITEAATLNNIGEIYEQLGDKGSALRYFLRSVKLKASLGSKHAEAYSLFNIARLYESLGDDASARGYYERSFKLREDARDKIGLIETRLALGEWFLRAGDLSESLLHLNLAALTLTDDTPSPLRAQAHLRLSNAYERHRDPAKRIQHLAAHREAAGIALRERNAAEAKRMMTLFELAAAKREALELGLSSEDLAQVHLASERAAELRDAPQATNEELPIEHVEVKTFGVFSVRIGGREISKEAWQRKKTRDVFKVLLLRYRQAVTTDELCDLLYPDAATKNVEPALLNAVSFLRKALEPDLEPRKPSRYLRQHDRTYTLDLGELATVDFLEFKKHLATAKTLSDAGVRRSQYEKAISIYAGEFLKEDLYEEWSAYERETLKEFYLTALRTLAEDDARHGRIDAALVQTQQLLATDPTDEAAYDFALALLTTHHRLADAKKLYKRCVAAFQKEYGTPPPVRLQHYLGSR
ncbi:MAG: tetratricopeptide repeat protein [Rhizobacter sp.]|nr:tetratricopeptide repeat protein [Chlorobiales bacterium]